MSVADSSSIRKVSSQGEETAPDSVTNGTAPEVESLGEALAGVNLGQGSPERSASFGVTAAPFSLPSASGPKESDAWGNFADVSQVAEAAFSGANNREQEVNGLHNDSLHLFLSRDPSQTLGEDVFKLSHPNLPTLSHETQGLSTGDASSAFRINGHAISIAPGNSANKNGYNEVRNEGRRRTESPSSAVTAGTTSSSRSASPYTNTNDVPSGGRTIQAYQPYDNAQNGAEENGTAYGLNQAPPPTSPAVNTYDTSRSPYKPKPIGNPYDFDQTQGFGNPTPAAQPVPVNPQPGQVLYMAVQSPDGRGQLLQPVQMVELPGKQMAYVVAGAPTQPMDNSMMVLPPIQNQMPDLYGGLGAIGSGMDNRTRMNNYGIDMNRSYTDISPGGRDEYGRGPAAGPGAQFQTDPAVASLYSAPQRPPLDALLGQVRRLSRDQVGCRLVQQALDEEGPMAASLILQEGLPFWGEAMVDPFGNYLFQKILEKVSPEERVMLVKGVSTRLVNASLNLHGTRSVQKVVELCAQDEQNGVLHSNNEGQSAADILTESLAPAAARLCIDSHGNHVIQRIILKLGSKHSEFVFDAVAASVGDVARHRHGCCVIQRCLDSAPSESRTHLVRRIVEKALELMQDAYGNYVVQYVLDVCSDEDVHAVCESVVGKVNLLAIQKFSSNVMEKCLERCSERVKELYMKEMSDPERIRELMMDPFGNYVVQRALSVATHAQAIRLVEAMRPHLLANQTGGPNGQRNGGVRNTAGGRRIIAKICRRFPNFSLTPVGHQDDMYNRNPGAHEDLYSRNKGSHRYHGPVISYAPVGAPPSHPPQHYMRDNRVPPGPPAYQPPQHHHHHQPQQQNYYNLGGSPYYDHFGSNGHGNYHSM